jgi:hypothetical protein
MKKKAQEMKKANKKNKKTQEELATYPPFIEHYFIALGIVRKGTSNLINYKMTKKAHAMKKANKKNKKTQGEPGYISTIY